jgi:hypothetical protein
VIECVSGRRDGRYIAIYDIKVKLTFMHPMFLISHKPSVLCKLLNAIYETQTRTHAREAQSYFSHPNINLQ